MIKTFPLSSRSKTTALKQPKEIFSIARDIGGEWEIEDDKVKQEYLSYYYLPDAAINSNIDLGGGYSNFRKIPELENTPNFKSLLDGITNYERKIGEKLNCDIITFRGIMTKLLTLPYNLKDDITLNIVAYDGSLFITTDESIEIQKRELEQQQQQQQQDDYRQRCEYSGYKFETVATLPKPWNEVSRNAIDNRLKKTVNNYEQYVSVVKTGIGNVNILLAGEVDCIWDYIPENNKNISSHYVELKTSKIIEHPGQVKTFEKKLFRTWAQCFLLGVRKIIYGFRDDNLILKSVEIFKTDEIPLLIKDNPLNQQNPNQNSQKIVCMNALKWYGAVVEWINEVIPKDDETTGWKLHYDSGSSSLSLMELSHEENKKLRNGGILNDEFRNWRQSLNK